MRAISPLRRDEGMSTRVCLAVPAFRIGVSMSAIGSVISWLFVHSPRLTLDGGQLAVRSLVTVSRQLSTSPAALGDSRHVALERQLAKAQPAQRELAHVSPRPAAQVAAIAMPNLVFQLLGFLRDPCSSGHIVSRRTCP